MVPLRYLSWFIGDIWIYLVIHIGVHQLSPHHWGHHPCKVVPQFVNAKLVPITPISLGFMVDISILFLWF